MANSNARGRRVFVTNDIPVALDASDIQIGAVELKNATTDDRASIAAANTARTSGTIVVANQSIDASGNVLSTAALATSAIQATQQTSLTSIDGKITAVNTGAVVIASSALPSGASTSALQPSLGTATAPSANVITTQRPSVTQVVSTALEASHVLKASSGQLIQLAMFNSKASSQFILIMNATSLPSNGAVTLLYPPIPIAAASLLVLDLLCPLVASTGIVVANSSTGTFSLTIGSADCAFYAQTN